MGRQTQETHTCHACGDTLPVSLFPRVKKEKICFKCRNIWKRYKVNHYHIEVILNKQKHRCAICGAAINGRNLNIDHCHGSAKVRGVLCNHCNVGLGHFKDDINSLRMAIKYLRKHGKSNTKKS